MKCYLTRQRDGNFMLTHYKPSIDRIRGTKDYDAYCIPGEPLGVRHLCEIGVLMLVPIANSLKTLESMEININVG